MMNKNIIQRLTQKARKAYITPMTLTSIRRQKTPFLSSVAEALELQQTGALSDEESRWIEAIEKLRSELCVSNEMVSVLDYGAGTPTDSMPEEERKRGVFLTEPIGEACRNYSKSRTWATLLFQLIRKLRPHICIEMGTCLGVSAVYQAAALEVNQLGKLYTLEGSPNFAAIAQRNIQFLGLGQRTSLVVGSFRETLGKVLNQVGMVDYAFIDGHHDQQATVCYFEELLPHLAAQSLLVFDDIDWSAGMSKAWQQIIDDPRVDVSFDLSKMGICLLGVGIKARYKLVVV